MTTRMCVRVITSHLRLLRTGIMIKVGVAQDLSRRTLATMSLPAMHSMVLQHATEGSGRFLLRVLACGHPHIYTRGT